MAKRKTRGSGRQTVLSDLNMSQMIVFKAQSKSKRYHIRVFESMKDYEKGSPLLIGTIAKDASGKDRRIVARSTDLAIVIACISLELHGSEDEIDLSTAQYDKR